MNKKYCNIIDIGINTHEKDDELNATYVKIDNDLLLNKIIQIYQKLMSIN